MTKARCQICGRPKALTAAGVIVVHYRRGDECAGAGAPPFGESLDAIEFELERLARHDRAYTALYNDHRRRRRNAPLGPSFWSGWAEVLGEWRRLQARYRRAQIARA